MNPTSTTCRAATLIIVTLVASSAAVADTVDERFQAPNNATRVAITTGSFAAWVRTLPLAPMGTPVRTFDGRIVNDDVPGVVALEVGERDLQQCADSLIRLHATFLRNAKRFDDVEYAFTNGVPYSYAQYLNGVRPVTDSKGRVTLAKRTVPTVDNDAAFQAYLERVFVYAGTASLAASVSHPTDEIRPGDFYVLGGFPGHAVMVLDVATHTDGQTSVLLGQGFMPAQSFHIVATTDGGAWHAIADDGALTIPSWSATFPKESRRRFGHTDKP